ncbi:MAG TPA: endonuclease/exonuclease/phosphatase family protein [Nocardioides sp.]|nr:endonuclease/exonuclease/phosphatase family protein [Nocardioides sp.]
MLSRIFVALLVLLALAGPLVPSSASADSPADRAEEAVVASFNVLGADHTDGRHPRRGFDESPVRLNRAIKLLRRTHVDLVGFQELQRPQHDRFLARVGDRWGIFTGATWDTDNSIAWRLDRFELVQGWSVAVPYFHGNTRYMPVVELRSLATDRHVFVMNTHHAADTRGDASGWRREAIRIERSTTRRLSNEHHAPVIMTGDMNGRADFFCPFTRNGVMHSFLGGRHPKRGGCRAPSPMGVDWILGNRHVAFDEPRIDRSALVQATTDHPLVSSRVTLR